ncbi:hypothetical protein SCLCIDRAFT_297223 [Scleroderma citrinum Foug A]|uniref:Uncharacterized protein n=1 Tax=Scleroderma citrinum Foug A TaxID=1036808 RepID=A0A0C2ZS43_9AGAM|nr:hypothetical protein SCLCIDRAFT_297223 [Scleroderma citrinum Foug A]
MIRVSGRICWVQLVSSVASSAGWNSLSAYKASIASSIAMRRYKDLLHAGYFFNHRSFFVVGSERLVGGSNEWVMMSCDWISAFSMSDLGRVVENTRPRI